MRKREGAGRGDKRERERERGAGRRSDMFAIIRNFMVSVRRTGTFLVYIYIDNNKSVAARFPTFLFLIGYL